MVRVQQVVLNHGRYLASKLSIDVNVSQRVRLPAKHHDRHGRNILQIKNVGRLLPIHLHILLLINIIVLLKSLRQQQLTVMVNLLKTRAVRQVSHESLDGIDVIQAVSHELVVEVSLQDAAEELGSRLPVFAEQFPNSDLRRVLEE